MARSLINQQKCLMHKFLLKLNKQENPHIQEIACEPRTVSTFLVWISYYIKIRHIKNLYSRLNLTLEVSGVLFSTNTMKCLLLPSFKGGHSIISKLVLKILYFMKTFCQLHFLFIMFPRLRVTTLPFKK